MMSTDFQICSACESRQENTIKLPFGRILCDKCMEIQCLNASDQLESHFGNQNFHLKKRDSPPPQDTEKSENIGVTLYNLKQSLSNLQYDIANNDKKINEKIEKVKLEININLNYCLDKLANKKAIEEIKIINYYKKKIIDRFDSKKLIRLKSQLALHIDHINKLKNGNEN